MGFLRLRLLPNLKSRGVGTVTELHMLGPTTAGQLSILDCSVT